MGSGRIVRFVPDPSGGYSRPEGFDGDLVSDGSAMFGVDWFEGTRWRFDNLRLVEMVSADKGSVEIVYNDDGLLTRIISSLGPSYELDFDDAGLATPVAAVVDGQRGPSVAFAYNAGRHLISATDAAGRVVEQVSATGEVSAFDYGAATTLRTIGSVDASATTRTDVYGYENDDAGYTTAITDPENTDCSTPFDDRGQLGRDTRRARPSMGSSRTVSHWLGARPIAAVASVLIAGPASKEGSLL